MSSRSAVEPQHHSNVPLGVIPDGSLWSFGGASVSSEGSVRFELKSDVKDGRVGLVFNIAYAQQYIGALANGGFSPEARTRRPM